MLSFWFTVTWVVNLLRTHRTYFGIGSSCMTVVIHHSFYA